VADSRAIKVAIIGGGMAGLAAARRLAAQQVAVQLFESNDKVGGCCGTTRVGAYTFNDGAIYLALPGMLDHLFRRLGLDRHELLPLRDIVALQSTTLPDGTIVTIGGGPPATILTGNSATDATTRRELQIFMARWDPVLRLFAEDLFLHRFAFSGFLAKGWRYLPMLRGTVATQLTQSFSSEAVRAALAASLLYIGMPPERMPALAIIALVAMLRDGYVLPEGGMSALPQLLARAAEAKGCRIHLGTPVRRILTQRGQLLGIETANGETVRVDAAISALSAMQTFGDLLPNNESPRRLRRKAQRAKLSRKGFVLQLGLRNRISAVSHTQAVVPFLRDQGEALQSTPDELRWPIYTVPTVTLPALAPPGGSVIEAFPPISQDRDAEYWTEERGASIAALTISRLKTLHDLQIEASRILSPREFANTFHLYAGTLYGLSPLAPPTSLFNHATPIQGLYLAGQTTWPGFGVVNAALAGIIAAERLMERQ
jgi:phytoene desaturase